MDSNNNSKSEFKFSNKNNYQKLIFDEYENKNDANSTLTIIELENTDDEDDIWSTKNNYLIESTVSNLVRTRKFTSITYFFNYF